MATAKEETTGDILVTPTGFVIDAAILGAAFGIDVALVRARMGAGEITSRCERGIDEDAGRWRLAFYCDGRALRLTVDDGGRILSRATFPARPPRPTAGQATG